MSREKEKARSLGGGEEGRDPEGTRKNSQKAVCVKQFFARVPMGGCCSAPKNKDVIVLVVVRVF